MMRPLQPKVERRCPHRAVPLTQVGRRWPHHAVSLILFLPLCLLLGACTAPQHLSTVPAYQPKNVFSAVPMLPPGVKRIAVLPIVYDANCTAAQELDPLLDSAVVTELAKTRKFELVRVTPELLRASTGQSRWSAQDTLPADFLARLGEVTGCEAIFFSHITTFRGYPPLALGFRLQLVEVESHAVLWSIDEVFDAGAPPVLAAARAYQSAQQHSPSAARMDPWLFDNSPQSFAQFAAAQAFATLPER